MTPQDIARAGPLLTLPLVFNVIFPVLQENKSVPISCFSCQDLYFPLN